VKQYRRKSQRVGIKHFVFFDQTNMRVDDALEYGLAPKGRTPLSTAKTRPQWSDRVDFCGAICSTGPLACVTMTPKDRKEHGVKGWTKEILLDWVTESLAPAIAEMPSKSVIVCTDKGLKITHEDIVEECHADEEAENVADAWIMPTNAGKCVNPCDNCMWAWWKRKVREKPAHDAESLAERMTEVFWQIDGTMCTNWIHKCGLGRGDDIGRDL